MWWGVETSALQHGSQPRLSDVLRYGRAGVGLPVCIVREALWAQQGGCDREPARLQAIMAGVQNPWGLYMIAFFVYTTN